MEVTATLTDLLDEIWGSLQYGAIEEHATFHTPVLGTCDEDGCHLRTVVLRRVQPEARAIICHTDIRSGKVAEIQRNPAVSWLFYSPNQKIQVRAEGSATVHHLDEIAQEAWRDSPLSSRLNYVANLAPGTRTDRPESGWPEYRLYRMPTEEESMAGWPNFSVVVSTITRLDWLNLDDSGHRRARFEWTGNNFNGTWIIP